MKRIIALLLTICLLLSFIGCTPAPQVPDPAFFYYPLVSLEYGYNKSVFAAYPFPQDGREVQRLLSVYLLGPVEPDCYNPFPVGTTIIALTQEDTSVSVTLSDAFAQLSGIDLIIACTALSKSIISLMQAETVTICVADRLLDGKSSITISKDSIHLSCVPQHD